MLERNVDLLNFQDARRISGRNHNNSHRKKLSLPMDKLMDFMYLRSIPVENLSLDDKEYLQKLFILNNLYEHINKGAYLAQFTLPFPLIPSVKDWVSVEGYCMHPTLVDYSYGYVDDSGLVRWHQAKASDLTAVCDYRILW